MDKDQLIAKFHSGQVHVAVVGMGYVGLPLALNFAEAGYKVTGIEYNAQRVSMLNRGVSYIEDVSNAELAALVAQPDVAQVVPAEAMVSQPARNGSSHLQSGSSGTFIA